ncbi:WhiB family transcriptional regulator [Nocardioides renjunii]|uniref:WhiB family transcriptional regulator n=1 Tax=Nocardioides renjunii TaxID=3095075 RepID=UPI0034DB6603
MMRQALAWRSDAACAQSDVEDVHKFFPSGRPSTAPQQLCARCPVADPCLEFALDSPWPPNAIVAGLTPRELEPLWRERHADAHDEIRSLLGPRWKDER